MNINNLNVGDYVKIEIGMGNFFYGIVKQFDKDSKVARRIIVDINGNSHTVSIWEIKKIYSPEEYPEYFI